MRFIANDLTGYESVTAVLTRPIEAVAFWTAIALPFLYIPLLVYGLETTGQIVTFLGLIILNVVAFVLGHGYHR